MIQPGMVFAGEKGRIGIIRVKDNVAYFETFDHETGDLSGYLWCLPVDYILLNYTQES